MAIQGSQTRSLRRALIENSQRTDWLEILSMSTEPSEQTPDDLTQPDRGSFVSGYDRDSSTPRPLFVIPICQGTPGTEFAMRIWAWYHVGEFDDVNNVVWIPLLLAEFRCVVGTKGGVGNRKLKENEYLCSTIEMTRGSMGTIDGDDISINNDEFGSWVKVDLQGCSKHQFDFRVTSDPAATMNALWFKTKRR